MVPTRVLQHIPAESGQMAEISAAPLCAAMRHLQTSDALL
jgi:hypothetical protein